MGGRGGGRREGQLWWCGAYTVKRRCSNTRHDPYALSQYNLRTTISLVSVFFIIIFFINTFAQLKQKNTITRYVNINVPGIQVKKGLNKEQRMVISENIC